MRAGAMTSKPRILNNLFDRGYALIELAVVFGLIAAVFSIAIPAYQSYQMTSRISDLAHHYLAAKRAVLYEASRVMALGGDCKQSRLVKILNNYDGVTAVGNNVKPAFVFTADNASNNAVAGQVVISGLKLFRV